MKKYIYIIISLLFLTSCSEDWMSDVAPTDNLDAQKSIKSILDARNNLNGIFSKLQSDGCYGASYVVYGDVKGCDVRSTKEGVRYDSQYKYNEFAEASPSYMFSNPYFALLNINNAIVNLEKLTLNSEKDEVLKTEIMGNLYGLRALCHFDLLRFYARIPSSVDNEADYLGIVNADKVIAVDEKLPRNTLKESYDLVVSDLKKAIDIIPESANTDGWLTKNSVKGLLARVYLYRGNNQEAYTLAQEVINSGKYQLIEYKKYKKAWGVNNSETMIQIVNTETDNPSREGLYNIWANEGYDCFRVTDDFKAILSADTNDIRKDFRIGKEKKQTFVKYPTLSSNVCILRFAEMYFIAAEAVLKKDGNKNEAATLINKVLDKRTDGNTSLAETDIDIDRIILERRKEFLGEGHAFFDFVRNKKNIERKSKDHLPSAPSIIKYDDDIVVLPIPRTELDVNPNIKQNKGY